MLCFKGETKSHRNGEKPGRLEIVQSEKKVI